MSISVLPATEYERLRATRVEVARLQALRYRAQLEGYTQELIAKAMRELVSTLPAADIDSWLTQEAERYSCSELDWSILDEPGVIQVASAAAARVAHVYADKSTATKDDMLQAAQILLAERAVYARSLLAKGKGLLHNWIAQRLADTVRHQHAEGSLDARDEYED